jgi:hypothetical protein
MDECDLPWRIGVKKKVYTKRNFRGAQLQALNCGDSTGWRGL